MKVTLLGTGTSTGVPMIGCKCAVCRSADSRNKRLRSSIYVEHGGTGILADTSIDLRQQAITYSIPRIDAVLVTHTHADHIRGIDEMRSFNYIQKSRIPIYGNAESIRELMRVCGYIFEKGYNGGGRPMLDENIIAGPFDIGGVHVTPVPVRHGDWQILAYRMNDFAYVTDANGIPPESMKLLEGLDLLVIGALGLDAHWTHFSLDEAVAVASDLKPRRTLFTHMSHQIDYAKINPTLPETMELGVDGMTIEI